jgi:LmbE family N-acetylglucosaminyl deacetylase
MLEIYFIINLLIILICIILARVIIIHKKRYLYNVKNDQNINYNKNTCDYICINKKDDNIYQCDIKKEYSSLFLFIFIKTDIAGYLFEPYIEITSGESKYYQYFEYGAKGKRVINITSALKDGDKIFSIKGKYIKINKVEDQIIGWKKEKYDDDKKNIIIISPHPDDAEISSYGFYTSEKNNVTIITITAGEGGNIVTKKSEKKDSEYHNRNYKKRFLESIYVPLLSGIEKNNVLNLGYYDGTIKLLYENRKNKTKINSLYANNVNINNIRKYNTSSILRDNTESTWPDLVEDICYIINQVKPGIIITPFPSIDSHSDHKYTTMAVVDALKKIEYKKVKIYLYTNKHHLTAYYPFGKKGSIMSVPPVLPNDFVIDNILSFHMTEEMLNEKKEALEMMSDLRRNVYEMNSKDIVNHIIKKLKERIYSSHNSYYRRGLMCNELFYIIDGKYIYDKDKLQVLMNECQ